LAIVKAGYPTCVGRPTNAYRPAQAVLHEIGGSAYAVAASAAAGVTVL
jgi:hypothetical protein